MGNAFNSCQKQQSLNFRFMYRINILLYFALFAILPIFAQNENDSINSYQLDEVVVKAYHRIQRGDTLCVIPNGNQRKFSFTGFEMLRSMMLPGLQVNVINGNLSLSDGGKAIVLIDGRPVERQDILALRPKEIARVEYLQQSTPEYGNDQSIGAIINVVMKKRSDGYAAAVVANNAITTGNGQNFAFGKYTRNNSEYAISINSDYTTLTKRRIDNYNTYVLGDQSHNIYFKGLDTPLKYTENVFQAGYNHFYPNKHILDITFKGVMYYSPNRAYAQEVTEDGKSPYFQLTEPYEKYLSPRLNIYYKHYLTSKSTITTNFAGNYRYTDYRYAITESLNDNFENPSYDYFYGTKSFRQSYIGEIKYLNKFNRKFNFNIGTKMSYAYTENHYLGENPSTDKQHDTNLYTYVSTYGYLGKLYYMASIGLSGRILNQNAISMTKWLPRPQLQFAYNLKGWRFNLYGTLIQDSPSLSEMASTEFQINQYEIKRGNPNLKDWWKYRFALKITKNIGILNMQNTLSYTNSHNPVMAVVTRKQDLNGYHFITSFDNQKRLSILANSFNMQCSLFNNLTISMGLNFKSYQSQGFTYSHNLNNWQFNIAADWYAKNWNVGINWQSSEQSLTGETVSYTGSTNTLYVNYIVGNQLRFGLIGQNLLSNKGPIFKESLESEYLIKNETTIVPAQANMIMLTVAWNFSVGKQRKEAKIDMTNEDNESSIFK